MTLSPERRVLRSGDLVLYEARWIAPRQRKLSRASRPQAAIMPAVTLNASDAIELGEFLSFLGDWLESDHDSLAADREHQRETLQQQQRSSPAGHVREAAVMALERDGHGCGRTIPVLSHDEVGLASPCRLPLIKVFSVQKYHNI